MYHLLIISYLWNLWRHIMHDMYISLNIIINLNLSEIRREWKILKDVRQNFPFSINLATVARVVLHCHRDLLDEITTGTAYLTLDFFFYLRWTRRTGSSQTGSYRCWWRPPGGPPPPPPPRSCSWQAYGGSRTHCRRFPRPRKLSDRSGWTAPRDTCPGKEHL